MRNLWFEGLNWDGAWEWTGANPMEGEWVPDKGFRQFFKMFAHWYAYGAGHGGDEYGNCTLYVRTPYLSVIWRYPTGHRQTDVEYHSRQDAEEWITRYISRDMWLEEYRDWKEGNNRGQA